ncbi:MAG: nucleotide pyrophosphohydrolase [Vicinamibacterales bacterium]|jgi:NTP pyrophosphatase (non-canonical NTP hydrolase)|nr:nucleotide pyrophosphohydrolase [Acidobacteriota bacterium]MDP6373421.1 nucleotide pyrophosphohydrolase [Vicinamibacterales bacterium]MDP6607441.1 nucleotide pyrophosphohydrolase [Vicinamibacterales bacterium]HAK55638.1 nucleotide pyrophosphohydrolase [Acidobacteriota bacterium]|tara:strand:- start:2627 stop:2977 length:351 start_codon:yes stop_codon:yes gene_type:complete
MNIAKLQQRLREFTAERDWDQFHSPKNLAMALTSEAGELAEVFQWMSEDQSRTLDESSTNMAAAKEELADVMIYLLRLTDVLHINLEEAVNENIALNEAKYPVGVSRGNATKYNRR